MLRHQSQVSFWHFPILPEAAHLMDFLLIFKKHDFQGFLSDVTDRFFSAAVENAKSLSFISA